MEEKENLPSENTENAVRVRPQKRKSWLPALVIFLLVAGGFAWLVYANEFTLTIRLEGEGETLVEYGQSYSEPGAIPVISGKWLFSDGFVPKDVTVSSQTDLNEAVLGKYSVTYTVQCYGLQASAQRTVRVVDSICPVIILNRSSKTVLPGEPYIEEGFAAVDNHDGNLTDKVRRSEKKGVVTYTVIDSSGNPASVQRKIQYLDPKAPEIYLEGGEYITIPCGTIYSEPGYSAKDNVDGDMTEDVAVVGDVRWYEAGTYEVVYTVADLFGNVTQKVRTVDVVAKPRPDVVYPNGRVIYLTFDDGPSPYTIDLLDLLKRYGVKATFFVTGRGTRGELWRMYKEGHSIGMHTLTHDYNSIYTSEEAFFNDLYGIQDIIYRETGTKPTLMRFPGGGSNLVSSYNEGIMTRLTQAVQEAGFQYFDWNVDSNDAGGALKRQTVANNVIEGVKKQRISIVLQHDIHEFSVDAVEDIIIWGLDNGYQFLPLKSTSPTMQHDVLN